VGRKITNRSSGIHSGNALSGHPIGAVGSAAPIISVNPSLLRRRANARLVPGIDDRSFEAKNVRPRECGRLSKMGNERKCVVYFSPLP
jgi:hypothetical protein